MAGNKDFSSENSEQRRVVRRKKGDPKFSRPEPKPRKGKRPFLRDERQIALVEGVANRVARTVYAQFIELFENAEDDDVRAAILGDALLMELWRAGSLVSFEGFAQDALHIDPEEARQIGEEYNKVNGREGVSGIIMASWYRLQSAFEDLPGATIHVTDGEIALAFDTESLFEGLQRAARCTRELHADQEPQNRNDSGRNDSGRGRGDSDRSNERRSNRPPSR